MRGVGVRRLGEDLRLKSQPDIRDGTIKKLKKKLQDVQQPAPRLRLSIGEDGSACRFRVQADQVSTIGIGREWVAANIAPLYPLADTAAFRQLVAKGEDNQLNLPEGASAIYQLVGQVGEAWTIQKNARLNQYFEAYAHYTVSLVNYQNDARRSFRIFLMLHNDGSRPAEDVNVILKIPQIVNTFSGRGLPPPPVPPLARGRKEPQPSLHPAALTPAAASDRIRLVRTDKRTGFSRLQYHMPRLNQHVPEAMPDLILHFPSFEKAESFTIQYRLAAANASDAVEGELRVQVEKPVPRRIAVRTKSQ